MDEKYSLEEEKTIKTGLITLLAVLLISFVTISHNASIKSKGKGGKYNIYANFGRTDGLNVGDVVRMSGVNIGRVIGATLDENYNSNLVLEIEDVYKIPDDSSASIVSFGLIGGKYVEIEVGGSEDYIEPEGSISYTQDAMVLEELLDRMIALGKSKKSKNVISNEDKGDDYE
ncbi:MAG: MCE family protein [Alphaproteobacteria bacterium]|nr:MCE family protein [Alphaproteobacteria bacterium]